MPHSVLQALLLTALLLLALGVRAHLIAENLFLRRQIQLFQTRGRRPRRPDAYTRLIMAVTSRLFDWRSALAVVQPQTLIRWQRQAFRRFWRAKSARPGRPPIPKETIELIRQMQRDNVTWGARRIANELKLKLGIALSHQTVAKYMHPLGPDIPIASERRPRIEIRCGQKRIAAGARIGSKSVLGGFHHEYVLAAAWRIGPYELLPTTLPLQAVRI